MPPALRSFLICLSPVLLAYLLVLVGGGISRGGDGFLSAALILIGLGSVVAGICVGRHVYLAMEPKGNASFLKVFLAALAFVGVGVAYFAVGTAGCCGVAILSDAIR
jgi:hypothetical protein